MVYQTDLPWECILFLAVGTAVILYVGFRGPLWPPSSRRGRFLAAFRFTRRNSPK